MKREIKYALTIPVSEGIHTDRNHLPICNTPVAKTSITAKQKEKDAEKRQLAILPLSAASFAAITTTRYKIDGARDVKGGLKLFIYYLKLII